MTAGHPTPRPGEVYVLADNDYRYGIGPIVARLISVHERLAYDNQPWWHVSADVAVGSPQHHGGWRKWDLYIRESALGTSRREDGQHSPADKQTAQLRRSKMQTEDAGQTLRSAWIAGVNKYSPGEPKPSYITPWDETPEWERRSAGAVEEQIRAFVVASAGATARLSRTQRGRFVALCWIAQIYRHIPDPKPAYVADWDDLPAWQQETDADIFTAVESLVEPAGW
jgi:hypothetical protein